jgi:CubicO group peptidase (beta-lactamase class C family)
MKTASALVLSICLLAACQLWAGTVATAKDRVLTPGDATAEGFDTAKLLAAEAWVEEQVEQGKFPGAVYLVARHGKIVLHGAVGVANMHSGALMKKNTLVWLASITKTITGTVITILIDEGKLSLDDPVAKYIPAFANMKLASGEAVDVTMTVRHLATHTAGLDFTVLESNTKWIGPEKYTLKDLVEKIAALPLKYVPGKSTRYSNAGMNTLARIVEIVSGQEYTAFLQKKLFDPLGMKDTSYFPPKDVYKNISDQHKRSKGKVGLLWRFSDETRRPLPLGANGIMTTAYDLAVHGQTVLNGGVYGGKRTLLPQAVGMMITVQSPVEQRFRYGQVVRRGVCWMVGPEILGVPFATLPEHLRTEKHDLFGPQRFFQHSGGSGTILVGDRDNDIVIVFAAQCWNLGSERTEFVKRVMSSIK